MSINSSHNLNKYNSLMLYASYILLAAISLLMTLLVLNQSDNLRDRIFFLLPKQQLSFSYAAMSPEEISAQLISLQKEMIKNQSKLARLMPDKPYLVVNTTGNDFALYNSKHDLLREGLVSSGSFTILKSGDNRQWLFKTPRGQLKVLGKTKNPVWKRPDWAFIEEGLKVPSPNHHSRYEYGTLGDYSLNLGDGYLIHGTLYQRFLGLPVTHGCIRMGDDDLEYVFRTLKNGSKVYIY